MNLREEILKAHSKAQAENIARWVGTDAERFAALMHLFLNDEYRVVQRASSAITKVTDAHPDMAVPYLGKMVQHMSDPAQPVAVKRNVVRLLQFIPLPEHLHAAIMNTCFDLLADPKETVAVRAFSMTVLTNLADTYPEIKQELRALIEDQLEQQTSPGFRSRGIKTLSLLQKQPIT